MIVTATRRQTLSGVSDLNISMPVHKHTAEGTVGFDQGSKMNSTANGGRRTQASQPGQQGQGKVQASRPSRPMHQSTLTLGDHNLRPCFITTHTQVRLKLSLSVCLSTYRDDR